MVAKANDRDSDVLGVVQRSLRQSTPELRTELMEVVVGAMIDGGDWGSIFLHQGLLSEAVEQYLKWTNRTGQQICGHCFDNLGNELKRKLKGEFVTEATQTNEVSK
jgi:hypothetical protein